MKKLSLKLDANSFLFLKFLLFKLVTYYQHRMPSNVTDQLLIELYQQKFNLHVVDDKKVFRMQLNRSVALALFDYLENIPLHGTEATQRDVIFNQIEIYLQNTSFVYVKE
ncbi:hypothetical protein [Sediminitomix flava]|uniref:Uncharacterized protein n=1 Tax=Sediminitomix flava TaxID=379075 RepID=A0A315ZE44_SEDFL|nr:hypothetical protein [Sediminitomix flava]PWJ43801.1 hypothetical protein BC781_101147 [Sediminitomix flava]